jgi:UDP-glucuronate 4-epimerase
VRVLVTGGAGFIGSHLIERLLEHDYQVVCIDNFDDYYSPDMKRRNMDPLLVCPGFQFVEGDIQDEVLLGQLLMGPYSAVVHLAARAGVRPSIDQADVYARTNVQGTITLLEASRRSDVRHFIFGSSSSVYGLSRNIPFKEDDNQLQPISPYGASKLAAEVYCATYHRLYGLPVSILRFFTVYGPRQRPDMAIHRFARLIEDEKPVSMYGDGTTRRDYTYVDDVVDGIVRTIERPDNYQLYNLGNSETIPLHDLILILEQALGKKAILSPQPPQLGDVPITYASIDRAIRFLGYSPKVKIEEGVRRFVEWLRANRMADTTLSASVSDGGL